MFKPPKVPGFIASQCRCVSSQGFCCFVFRFALGAVALVYVSHTGGDEDVMVQVLSELLSVLGAIR